MLLRRSIVLRLLILSFALPVTLTACNEEGGVKVEEEEQDPQAPPANVDLPPAPPAEAFEIPEKNPDGSLRVQGLIHHQENHLDGQVEVKGIISYMSKECDPGKAKKAGEKCPEPHLYIKDSPDERAMLQVVGYDDDFLKRVKLEVGEEHVFKGTYQKVAQGFVATEDGLILLDYVDDEPVLVEK